jgi:dimethylhistidine N-methyltransferase
MTLRASQTLIERHSRKPNPVADAVRMGLSMPQKSLPAWLFYDARGSQLFEQITDLPEYYLTRAEREILETHADDIVAMASEQGARTLKVIELGAGAATKTQILLRAVVRRQKRCLYVPIDVSASALESAAERLRREEPQVQVQPVAASHLDALSEIRAAGPRRLVLFLGSSIGNYEDEEAIRLLSAVGRALLPGAGLLIGADRRKDPAVLIPAYDDAQGVTAQFNLNVLVRLNRELGANFDLHAFRHEARWNDRASRVEMHLVSMVAQQVDIPLVGSVSFAQGESIHTESSIKYDCARMDRLLGSAGFRRVHTFADSADRFDLHLAQLTAQS